MKRVILVGAVSAVLLTGCSSGVPKVVTPETSFNFGNVPVVTDMRDGKTHEFVIKNEGTGNLRLSNIQVKLLEGC